jgi:hypothetical protein
MYSTTEVFTQEDTVFTREALGLVGTVLRHWAANFATKHWISKKYENYGYAHKHSNRISISCKDRKFHSCSPLAQADRVHKIILHRCHITALNFPRCAGYFNFGVGNRNKNVTRRRRSQPQHARCPRDAFVISLGTSDISSRKQDTRTFSNSILSRTYGACIFLCRGKPQCSRCWENIPQIKQLSMIICN